MANSGCSPGGHRFNQFLPSLPLYKGRHLWGSTENCALLKRHTLWPRQQLCEYSIRLSLKSEICKNVLKTSQNNSDAQMVSWSKNKLSKKFDAAAIKNSQLAQNHKWKKKCQQFNFSTREVCQWGYTHSHASKKWSAVAKNWILNVENHTSSYKQKRMQWAFFKNLKLVCFSYCWYVQTILNE